MKHGQFYIFMVVPETPESYAAVLYFTHTSKTGVEFHADFSKAYAFHIEFLPRMIIEKIEPARRPFCHVAMHTGD